MVTKQDVLAFAPSAKPSLVSAVVDNWAAADAAEINTPKRIRQFFANMAVETGGLTLIVENLNYSSADRIYEVFKGPPRNPRFKSVAECKSFVKNPKALAIKVYGGRMGNAAAPSDDGFVYRGGGMLQTTGREGYRNIGFESNPSVLQTDPATAFKTACQEWSKRGCNALADDDRTVDVRKAVNGGTNGLADVKTYLSIARKVWPDGAVVAKIKPVPPPDVYGGEPNATVRSVQERLDALGYPEVGKLDGRWGERTAGAITTFQGDNSMPLDPHITDGLLAALMTAKPRVIATARANATVADLRKEGAEDIKQADQTKIGGAALTAGGVAAGGLQALGSAKDASDTAKSIWDNLAPVQQFIQDNWWIFVIAAGLFVIWKSGLLQKIRLQKHQTGQDVSA